MTVSDDDLEFILRTREKFEWPYRARLDTAYQLADANCWCADNCKHEWKFHHRQRIYSFRDEEDHLLFTMTWS
jgi:hypothetical protein